MKVLIGIILIALGVCTFVFKSSFSYKTKEKIIDIGPIQATTETEKNLPLYPVAGWVLIGTGAAVTVLGLKGKK